MSGRDCHTMADTDCHGAVWSHCHTMADIECHDELLNWSCQVDKCLVVTVTPWQILNVTVRCKLVLSGERSVWS